MLGGEVHGREGVGASLLAVTGTSSLQKLPLWEAVGAQGLTRARAGSLTLLRSHLPPERGEVPLCVRQPVWT